MVYVQNNQYEQALRYCQEALEIACEIGNRRAEGVLHGTPANIFQEMAQYEKSIASYQQSLDNLRDWS